jgi:hypothetical protein
VRLVKVTLSSNPAVSLISSFLADFSGKNIERIVVKR